MAGDENFVRNARPGVQKVMAAKFAKKEKLFYAHACTRGFRSNVPKLTLELRNILFELGKVYLHK